MLPAHLPAMMQLLARSLSGHAFEFPCQQGAAKHRFYSQFTQRALTVLQLDRL
jgi:hypothetical protein